MILHKIHPLLLLLFIGSVCTLYHNALVSGVDASKETDNGSTDNVDITDDFKYPQTCHSWTGSTCEWEPNLKEMTVQYSNGIYNETFYAYVTPDVSTFYNETPGTRKAKKPTFRGMFAKFINMSPQTVQVFWSSGGRRSSNVQNVYIADIEPFGSAGTATFPGHKFVLTPNNDAGEILTEWTIQEDNSLYCYDPFDSNPQKAQKQLSAHEYHMYFLQLQNRAFAVQYRQFTGKDWLALYKEKHPPRYHMWRADSFGQIYTVITEEIHFVELPPQDELQRGTSVYGPRPDEISRMRRYRDKYPTLQLQLKVLSCAPRVFEIKNFLSDVEVDHILNIAAGTNMRRSSTTAGEKSDTTLDKQTRTSRNSWIARSTDLIMDAIHRRAGDILQIHESLLRWRRTSEIPEFTESMISTAERLQMVHYEVGEQYTPHHDFSMPAMVHGQPSRFATVLFYLNDDMEGGETSFPRWLNAETGESLKVKPERGKAILFYNLLPDGNYDERSLHAALPVTKGEKFLTNLWVWDPILDQ